MFPSLKRIRPEETRVVGAAFFTLFGAMTGHLLMETARDALFLASVPPSQLPWVYLGVAITALVLVRAQRAVLRQARGGGWLVGSLIGGSVVTLSFWLGLSSSAVAGLYALYIWSGVLVTVLVVQFWSLLSDLFTVQQAKRLYPFMGSGAVLGALAGAGAANVIARASADQNLLLGAAITFALAAIPARMLPAVPRESSKPLPRDDTLEERHLWTLFRGRPYVRHVAALVVVSAMTLTVVDFVFKSAVVEAIPAERLGAFFALVYLVLNGAALVVQFAFVAPMMRRLGVTSSLLALPALLVLGSVGLLVSGGIAAAIALKAADGILRHSINRGASELLYVPMPDRVRARVKDVIDILGQRGGQAAASVVILLLLGLAGGRLPVLTLLVLLLATWLVVAAAIRKPYLDVFRRTLDELALNVNVEFPALDMASLETLIRTLDSANDREVLAALDILGREEKTHLVPALILYHPSPEVVVKALELFSASGRTNFVPIADRLLGTAGPDVHAAIVRARQAVAPDPDLFATWLDSSCPATRTTAIVALHQMGRLGETETRAALDAAIVYDPLVSSMALARAIGGHSTPLLATYLLGLGNALDPDVRRQAVRTMSQLRGEAVVECLVYLLADPLVREDARWAIVAQGDAGLEALASYIDDHDLEIEVRWELPRTTSLFPPRQAAPVLMRHLRDERDGMMEYRIIRALETVVSNASAVRLDRGPLDDAARTTLHEACSLLDWRVSLERDTEAHPDRRTRAHSLLVRLLRDKERHAIDRLIRLVGLRNPHEDFGRITRGLTSTSRRARSSSTELLEFLVTPELRTGVMAIIDDADDATRLQGASSFHPPADLDYEAVLQQLLEQPSRSLRTLAVAQIGELGLGYLRPRLEHLEPHDAELLDDVLKQALQRLQPATA
jgi:AAA family ATP:ADP antiporter